MLKRKNDNQKKRILAIVGFVIFAIVMMYPVVSSRWNAFRSSQQVASYRDIVSNKQDYTEEWEKAEAYNQELGGGPVITSAEYQTDGTYESILNIAGDGMMGYIEIPCIDVTEPIYHYSSDSILDEGIGHIHGSSLPIGGASTHAVLTGHRGLPTEKYFKDLGEMKNGDKFYLHILDQVLAYEVCDIQTVLPEEVSSLEIEPGKDLVTLVTCTPYGINTHRLLVTGKRVPFHGDVENGLVNEKHKIQVDPAEIIFFGFLVFIVSFFITGRIRNRHKNKE